MVSLSESSHVIIIHALYTYKYFFSMKLDKAVVQRRLDLMASEGVVCFWKNFMYRILS